MPRPRRNLSSVLFSLPFVVTLQGLTIVAGAALLTVSEIYAMPRAWQSSVVVPFILLGFPASGFLGLLATWHVLRQNRTAALTLFVVSFLMISAGPPTTLANYLSRWAVGWAKRPGVANPAQVVARGKTAGTAAASLKRRHYQALADILKSPQKVVSVRDKFLILANGLRVRVQDSEGVRSQNNMSAREPQKFDYLAGTTLNLQLVDYPEFLSQYTPAAKQDDRREQHNTLLLQDGESYGDIPVRIAAEGPGQKP